MLQTEIIVPAELVRLVLGIVALAAFVGANAIVLVWLERKVAGHIQRRPGPFEVGPYGLLQTAADAAKLIGKQLTMPAGADAFLFWLAPILAFLPVFVLFMPIPFGENLLVPWTWTWGLVLILAYAGFGGVVALSGRLVLAQQVGPS